MLKGEATGVTKEGKNGEEEGEGGEVERERKRERGREGEREEGRGREREGGREGERAQTHVPLLCSLSCDFTSLALALRASLTALSSSDTIGINLAVLSHIAISLFISTNQYTENV